MEQVLTALRAAAEETRLRILAILAETELTVSELVEVIGQSQPRVSRHLKVLCDAGLLERFREGSWVFYRLNRRGQDGRAAQHLLELLPEADQMLDLDRSRLTEVSAKRDQRAQEYFRANANEWDSMRSLHVDESHVEAALLRAVGGMKGRRLLDVGTGTGRVLELLGRDALEGLGIDASREMLEVARARLRQSGLTHCAARLGDMYQLPVTADGFDQVVIHQVLHYADRPSRVIAEAARVLRPGGQLLVVDFAPHELEELRGAHAHRRLGFADEDLERWAGRAGLSFEVAARLPGEPLTVVIWALTAKQTEKADAA